MRNPAIRNPAVGFGGGFVLAATGRFQKPIVAGLRIASEGLIFAIEELVLGREPISFAGEVSFCSSDPERRPRQR